MANLTSDKREQLVETRRARKSRIGRIGRGLDASDFLNITGNPDGSTELADDDIKRIEREYLSLEQVLSDALLALIKRNPNQGIKATDEARLSTALSMILGTPPGKRGAKPKLADEPIVLRAAERLHKQELGFDEAESSRKIFRDALVAEGELDPSEDRIRSIGDKFAADRRRYLYLGSDRELRWRRHELVQRILDALAAGSVEDR